jgi:hypothetical protein
MDKNEDRVRNSTLAQLWNDEIIDRERIDTGEMSEAEDCGYSWDLPLFRAALPRTAFDGADCRTKVSHRGLAAPT